MLSVRIPKSSLDLSRAAVVFLPTSAIPLRRWSAAVGLQLCSPFAWRSKYIVYRLAAQGIRFNPSAS